MAPALSVCIPTYNYGRFIAHALESVVADGQGDVEIVVLDGGSTDETRQIVERFMARHANVRYVQQAGRGGIDLDLARSIELARGRYCWLLSADDALAPGALREAMRAFEQGHDLVLSDRMWCDATLTPLGQHDWLAGPRADQSFDLSDRGQLIDYLRRARSLGALFSFMSVIGFRRELWLRAPPDALLAGSNYSHVGRLFAMGLAGARLRYIRKPLVLCRGGDDSFRSRGLSARLAIDLRGYLQLSRILFPDQPALQEAFRAIVSREHPWRRWLRARAEVVDRREWQALDDLLAVYGYRRAYRSALDLVGGLASPLLRRYSARKREIQLRQ